MRIVSSNSDKELAARESILVIQNDLRELAANLLRVIRGAGKPHLLAFQTYKLTNSLVNYEDSFGRPAGFDDLANALDFWPDAERMVRWSEDDRIFADAEHMMTRGALQIVASSLLGQRTQEAAGEHELHEGARHLEDYRKRRRAEMAAAARTVKLGAKKSTRRKKTGTKRLGSTKPAKERPSVSK